MSDHEILEIKEYIVIHFEDYASTYLLLDSIMSFETFLKKQVTVDLRLKYNKAQIDEAFDDHRIKNLVDFLSYDRDDDEQLN